MFIYLTNKFKLINLFIFNIIFFFYFFIIINKVVDLIENGRNISVTNENKKEYVKRFCYAKMGSEI